MATLATERPSPAASPGRLARLGPDLLPLALVAAVFALARIAAQVNAPPIPYPDTGSYAELDFFGGATRIWGVPLFWKLIPGGQTAEAYVQVLLAIVVWLVLAMTVYRVCRDRRAGLGGYVVVLLLGLCVQTYEWDIALLSESLSISLMVLLTAAVLLVAQRLTPGRAVFFVVTLCWWAASRQANVTILAAVIVPILVWLAVKGGRNVRLWIVLPTLVVTVWSVYVATQDEGIWKQNATGIVQERLLPDADARAYFYEHGMPRIPLVEEEAGKPYEGSDSPLDQDPAFQGWLEKDFKGAYVKYLLRNPVASLRQPILAAPELLSSRSEYTAAENVLPVPLAGLVWPNPVGITFFVLCVLALAAYVVRRAPSWHGLIIPGVGLVSGGFWAIVTWHQCVNEQLRLFAPTSVLVHLALVLLVVFSIDALRSPRDAGDGRAQGPEASGPDDDVVGEPLPAPAR